MGLFLCKEVVCVAADMVRMCPALSERVKILDSQKRLIYQPTGSIYQALSADVGNKHGFNTHGVVFDELHTQPNRKLFDVMTKGSGDARMQPLYDAAFDLEAYFRSEFARRIGNKEEEAFLTGDGSGKPTGIFNTTGGGQLGVTAASATAITADELIDLFYSLNSAYRKNAVWLLNDSTMKNIRKLKDSNGQYLWQPALHEGGFDTLLGKRIYTSPHAPELAAGKKTVAFGDFNYYWIGDRVGITFKRLNERFAETGQIGFIASKRLDGKLILPEAIKVLQQKGTSSGS